MPYYPVITRLTDKRLYHNDKATKNYLTSGTDNLFHLSLVYGYNIQVNQTEQKLDKTRIK